MKRTTHFCTTAEIKLNLDKAIKILGENGFLNFTPAPEYKVKQGFVAFASTPNRTLFAEIVLLRSRGSFLELRVDSETFAPSTLDLLRKYLFVPIRQGPILPLVKDWSEYVDPKEREEFVKTLNRARL